MVSLLASVCVSFAFSDEFFERLFDTSFEALAFSFIRESPSEISIVSTEPAVFFVPSEDVFCSVKFRYPATAIMIANAVMAI